MTRQVTDNLYIELDYFTPEDYYVYTANAAAAAQSTVTVTATTGFLKDFTVTISDAFTPTVTANVTKNLDAILDTVATMVTEPNRLRSTSTALSSEFTVTADGSVGGIQEATANLSTSATVSAVAVKTATGSVSLSAEFTQTTQGGVFRNISADLDDHFAVTTDANITFGFGAGLSSDAAIACVNYRVRNEAVDLGALFNTAVSATATVNSFAVLDSVSTVSVTADRFANVTAALAAEATMTTVAESNKPSAAALSSAFTQTADAARFRSTAVAVASAATVSATATSFKGIIETLSSAFTQTTVADAILLFRDQLWINNLSNSGVNLDLSTVQEKFGAKSLRYFDRTASTHYSDIVKFNTTNTNIYDLYANDWTIEFWWRDDFELGSTPVANFQILTILNSSGNQEFEISSQYSATSSQNQFYLDGPDLVSSPGTRSVAINTWHHVAVSYQASGRNIRAYVNGTRIINSTMGTGFNGAQAIHLGYLATVNGGSGRSMSGYLDELRISDTALYTGTSLTVPTVEFVKNRKNIGLFKFEDYYSVANTVTPSETVLQSGDAGLSAAFTQSTAAIKVVNAEADLVASGGQLTLASKNVEAVASLSAAFTQSATVLRIKNSAINNMDAHTEISVTPSKIVRVTGDGPFASVATLTVDAKQFKGVQCTANSSFTQTTAAVKNVSAVSAQSSAFTQTTINRRFRSTAVAQSAAFTQSVTAQRFRSTAIAQSSQASLSAIIGSRKQFDATLPSIATTLAASAINATGTILLESAFTQSATATRIFDLTTISEPLGVTFKNSSSFGLGDQGPFLGNSAINTQLDVTRFLMSFYVSRNSKGVVFDFEHTGSNDSNRIKLREDGSDWYFDYYGNDAAAGIYPVVSFRLGYDSNQGYQHYLFYMDLETGADTLANTVNMYKLFLNGQEQELAQVGRRYATLSYRHPLDIEQTTIGIALSSDIPGTGPGYFELVDSVSSDPSITTVWIDTGNVYDLTDSSLRNKFYNGKYLDLGASGTSTGLSQPDYYFRLRDYTERSQGGTATITGNTLNWYYVDAPSNVITNFTSSTEQNSQSVYQTIAASTSLDAELSGVILASANLNSTTTVTAVTGYLTPASATLSSQASVAVSGGRITRYLAGLNSEFTQTTTATKLFGIILTLSAETAVSATARLAIRHQGSATLSSQAALAVTGKNFVGVSAVLSSAATLACEGRIPQLAEATATLSASMTVTADVTVIPPVRTSADLTAAATMTIVAVKNFGGEVQMDSQFGISFQLDRFRSIVSNSNSQFTQTVIGKRIKFGSANLPAVATQLTAGTNIHIDPFYQIKVEPESRQGTVRPENRVIQVEQETRLNMIL